MATLMLAAAAGEAVAGKEFGLLNALNEGGIISWSVFIILVFMSLFSFYIMFTKLLQQQKIINQGKKVRASFWNSANLKDASSKLEGKSAYRAIVEDALVAQDQHGKLTDPVDQQEWVAGSPPRSPGAIGAGPGEGSPLLPRLRTVASRLRATHGWRVRTRGLGRAKRIGLLRAGSDGDSPVPLSLGRDHAHVRIGRARGSCHAVGAAGAQCRNGCGGARRKLADTS